MDHDTGYKLLFPHPDMVADLLRGFVREDWVTDPGLQHPGTCHCQRPMSVGVEVLDRNAMAGLTASLFVGAIPSMRITIPTDNPLRPALSC
ncbi:MAG: hypothetical protein MZV65_36695 [Chromatiales bacterium]|nr:hypothetical protein [Chromatiales bacterium]